MTTYPIRLQLRPLDYTGGYPQGNIIVITDSKAVEKRSSAALRYKPHRSTLRQAQGKLIAQYYS